MKLTVTRLGRVDHAEIALAPLTVFVGPNNTNKTWVTYALFGLLEGLRWEDQRTPGAFDSAPALLDAMDTVVKRLQGKALPNSTLVELISSASFQVARPLAFGLGAAGIRAAVGHNAPIADEARVALELAADWFSVDPIGEMRLSLSREALLVEFPFEDTGNAVYAPAGLAEQVRAFAHARFPSVRCLPVERSLLASIAPEILSQRLPLRRPLVDFAFMMAKAQARAGEAEGTMGSKLAPFLERTVGGKYRRTDGSRRGVRPG
ncbi:MAG: hypothetical protein IPF92_30730 [Myxococcales bacterium]|nr:hypothetical protein [Myxococcales bacterium]